MLLVCNVGLIGAFSLHCIRLSIHYLDNEYPRLATRIACILNTVANVEGLCLLNKLQLEAKDREIAFTMISV